MHKKLPAFVVSAAAMLLLAGCGKSNDSQSVDTHDDGKMMTVTVYDDLANYQGVEKGWFAKIVKDKFNMKLKIIAPNVAGGGQTLFDLRSAAGNLGDIVITSAGSGRAKRLAKSGLISDMKPYAKNAKYLHKYQNAINSINKQADKSSGMWGIPDAVSSQKPTAPGETLEPTTAPYIRWDYYKKIGYPKVKNMDQLLNVLKKMQDVARKENPGKKIYALSLFKDWDGDTMQNALQPMNFYGKNIVNYTVTDNKDTMSEPVLKKGGEYYKALKFFNKANQMGLVDPESSTQNYDKMFNKYQNGQVLFSFWSYLGNNAFNTAKNMRDGKGFKMLNIQNMKIFSYGATPNGDSTAAIYLGAKAKNKSRIVKFINWLYSPEGAMDNGAGVGGNAGPKGMTWTLKNNKPVLTKFGKEALIEKAGDVKVPAKYGTGTFKDGVSALNVKTVLWSDKDPLAGNYPYAYQMWPSVKALANTALDKDWSRHMDGAKTSMDYLKKNNKLAVAPGADYYIPDESSEVSTIHGQVKSKITTDSWKAIFAKNDSQFNSIYDQMLKETDGLGMKKVMQYSNKAAKERAQARKAIVKQYENK